MTAIGTSEGERVVSLYAAFHGRPELGDALTKELAASLPSGRIVAR